MNFILIFTLQCVFPIFNNGADDYTGLSIVNPNNVAHDFSISAIAGSSGATEARVAMINTASMPTTIVAALIPLDGTLGPTATFTLRPRETLVLDVASVFTQSLPDNGDGGKQFEGYMRVSSDAPVVAWQRLDSPAYRSMLRAIVPPEKLHH